MSWIAVGVTAVSAGSNIMSGISNNKAKQAQNKAIETMARVQAKIKTSYLDQANDIKIHDLLAMTQDIDNAVGLELTNLLYNSEKSKGELVNVLADRNVYGNSASRASNTINIQSALSNDVLQAKLEENYKSINSELDSTRYAYERDSLDIQLGLAGALSQQDTNFKSPLSIGMDGIMGGLQGYQLGAGLASSLSGVTPDIGSVANKKAENKLLAETDSSVWWKG